MKTAIAQTLATMAIVTIIANSPALASDADVLAVEISKSGSNYRFDVTVRHDDTGWDHYANSWEVIGPDGTIYAKRILAHPHVGEQPFTRSMGKIVIPVGVKEVTVRAGDNIDGIGGKTMQIKLP